MVPAKHQPLDSDGTIPSYHLHNFEHSISLLVSLSMQPFQYYSITSFLQHRFNTGLHYFSELLLLGQELLLFHLHSTDHHGVEGQYHWLLQIVIFLSFATTLFRHSFPQKFLKQFCEILQHYVSRNLVYGHRYQCFGHRISSRKVAFEL